MYFVIEVFFNILIPNIKIKNLSFFAIIFFLIKKILKLNLKKH